MSLDEDVDRYIFDLVAPNAYAHGLKHAGGDYLDLSIGSLKLLQNFREMEHQCPLIIRLFEFGQNISYEFCVFLDSRSRAGSNDKHKV